MGKKNSEFCLLLHGSQVMPPLKGGIASDPVHIHYPLQEKTKCLSDYMGIPDT